MSAWGRNVRWLSIVLAAALVVTACGSDSSEGTENSSAQTDSDQEGSDDGTASEEADTGSTDADDGSAATGDVAGSTDSDEDGSGESASGDADTETTPTSGEVDCDSIETALDSAGSLVGGDPALFGSSPEQQFEEARATMLALKEQAPEIASDVDETLAGLEVIADAFEEIGWDTDFESDPVAAVRLVQLAFSDPAVSGMITSVANIGAWLAANCAS